ncbi:MAG: NAD(P)H-dependent flavin oxidoreductase [Candidatus Limnocylindria bacterium]
MITVIDIGADVGYGQHRRSHDNEDRRNHVRATSRQEPRKQRQSSDRDQQHPQKWCAANDIEVEVPILRGGPSLQTDPPEEDRDDQNRTGQAAVIKALAVGFLHGSLLTTRRTGGPHCCGAPGTVVVSVPKAGSRGSGEARSLRTLERRHDAMPPESALMQRLGFEHPIIQAPMAGGATTVELVAAVCRAGALGFLGCAYSSADAIEELRQRGPFVMGTATTVDEAVALEGAGVDAIVAQGAEAGAHRGTFGPSFDAAMIGTMALVPQVVDAVDVPVIA